MGKERIELKKIEKTAARHVTFSKRRKGLIKKAKELSIMCDADVGLIVFSATGRLFEYSSSSMKMILKKYSESFTGILNIELDIEDFGRLKQDIENNNYTLRHMDGEDLQGLTIKNLQSLEQMLEVGLHRIRSTKVIVETSKHCGLQILPKILLFQNISDTFLSIVNLGSCIYDL
ncbi:MADS-box protein JOINTLESS-like [Cryptomeria japonica]|uniref:MADS-box protein JOINTLESS-like n=1 Tax=Cryptomeria japonica TaxID=3369 RepID=UPI0027D9F86F|nr:MADS-box protein JOINTLESS-like [Cryptomeria japonica]XP_059067969.1 MADS-box protein JOINTLESS-like [Cryptomeria japonica]XP_059067970.1 MADS-box protein JOINTLESS-like [Cryptomeria japonica]XP_059067971.1 MADS-box protein JOINTLESS-like [Cryptomeria japonica]XP_059067972.1 MADS-box protein JOINTLESS-like [Cryptomeria japonica]